ncbi:hypothetical protein [Hymenobacter terrestris]|uniref:Uncharacterized protein n=1 Tax=Hymenobacter terrestris TaxID=2748310 RepID=A0ABX2Q3G6_9BACT|nr:hypothetical protein [Hymenobacter terrestris]NVO85378.1 hypothetical protein [Hymenobacter terrestris]
MQPEDIDKLFRERLAGHAPTPPTFVWAEIEAEIQPAKRRRPAMWLAAASVALLVLLGAAGWLLTGGLAPAGRPELAATAPARVPAGRATDVANAAASNNNSADEQELLAAAEINNAARATAEAATPSGPSEATATVTASGPAALVATTVRVAASRPGGVQPGPTTDRRPPTSSATVALGLPANEPAPVTALAATAPDLPKPTLAPALKRPAALSTATVALTGPIEVDVRPAYEAPELPQPARRRGVLAVLRQVRNVVKGEPVSLTAAGLPETVTVQARLGSRTLTKTIQL